jgi:hypothetical protein
MRDDIYSSMQFTMECLAEKRRKSEEAAQTKRYRYQPKKRVCSRSTHNSVHRYPVRYFTTCRGSFMRNFISQCIVCITFGIGYTYAQPCQPPCRQGYICIDNECISQCNPPCPPGYRCDPSVRDCIPIGQELQKSDQPPSSHDCGLGSILLKNRCEDGDEVISTGLGMFIPNTIFFGLGSVYVGATGVIMSRIAWHDSHSDRFGYDSDAQYDQFTGIMSLAPQSSLFVIFGPIAQIPKIWQARNLRWLGEESETALLTTGWALYGASIATSTITIVSFINNKRSTTTTFAIANAAVLASSFGVHVAGYAAQRKKLRAIVLSKTGSTKQTGNIIVVPYSYCLGFANGAGIRVIF